MKELLNFVAETDKLAELTGQSIRPTVTIAGSYNAGKSTLLNCLLGESISPVGAVPTTGCLLCFDYGESFHARYVGPRDKCIFTGRDALTSFLANRKPLTGRMEIVMPSPFLKKCRLIDTPGLDAFTQDINSLAEQGVFEADKIIYLFHQRGIENSSRIFLERIAAVWKNRNLHDLSFWLNCNMGYCDGSSLEATQGILRKIFIYPVRLTAVNLLDSSNMTAMRLFVEADLAGSHLANLAKVLQQTDAEIPARLRKTARIDNRPNFLSEFWSVLETAERLSHYYQTMHLMPFIKNKMAALLTSINQSNLHVLTTQASGRIYRPSAGGLKEGKKLILDLLDSLKKEKLLYHRLEHSKLGLMAAKLKKKRFVIVATGGFSTGKSTFFNALMKEDILPVGNAPTTASITRISHGKSKTAIVQLPLQVVLHIDETVGLQSHICSDKLEILDKYLENNFKEMAGFEVCWGDGWQKVTHREMMELIKQTCDLYAIAPNTKIYKSISLERRSRKKPVRRIRLTFHYAARKQYNLTDPAQLTTFKNLTRPENAFRLAGIELQHPAAYLELMDFIDTPGLDAIQKHYFDEIHHRIQHCDAYLIFLNARHILQKIDKTTIASLLSAQSKEIATAELSHLALSEREVKKVFFVINFADTLSSLQQETVVNFVRQNIGASLDKASVKLRHQIFLISALRAITGSDRGMASLLRHLEGGIMGFRGREFYNSILNELYALLEDATEKIKDEQLILGRCDGKRESKWQINKQTLASLREFRWKIKRIKSIIYNLGGL